MVANQFSVKDGILFLPGLWEVTWNTRVSIQMSFSFQINYHEYLFNK